MLWFNKNKEKLNELNNSLTEVNGRLIGLDEEIQDKFDRLSSRISELEERLQRVCPHTNARELIQPLIKMGSRNLMTHICNDCNKLLYEEKTIEINGKKKIRHTTLR